MTRIRLQNITKKFGSAVTAVDNLTLELADGEFVALLGPSGCGKTTTLRILAGLETPTTGQIFIGDRDVTKLLPRDRDIGMVFQDYALYPHMDVFDNIAYPLKVRGADANTRRARVDEVAKLLQIGHLLARKPGQLSGGQQQRASVARALVHQPQAFLFDEPLSNLDAKLRLDARTFLKHLQREMGVTSIYVTHDQAEAMALADRIAVMDRGRIVQIGTPLDVYKYPATTFVAGFIGNPPMNLLPCTVEGGAVRLATGQIPMPNLSSRANGAKMIGIRAEKLIIDPAAGDLTAQVYAVQPLGGEVLVTLRVGEELVTARLFDEEVPTLPEQVYLRVQPEHVLLYDAEEKLIR